MPFNPDDYLAAKTGQAPSGGFDPDSYLASKTSPDLVSQFSDKLKSIGTGLGDDAKDLGLGAVQGATLGFADELQGGGQAALDAIQHGQSINPLNDDFIKKYREYQKGAEKKYKDADDRSPWLYGAGNILGGVATAPLLGAGTAGLATSGGRAAVKAALAEGGMSAAAKAALMEGGKDALVSAPAGALMGAGFSEGGLDTEAGRSKLGSDALHGAEMGGLVGGALGVATSAVPVAAEAGINAIKGKLGEMDTPFSRMLKKSYGLGREGINPVDETNRASDNFMGKARKTADELNDTLDSADSMYGSEIGKTLKSAQDSGVTLNVEPDIQEAFGAIEDYATKNPSVEFSPKAQKVIAAMAKDGSSLSPEEANMLKKELFDLHSSLKMNNSVSPAIKEQVLNLYGGVKNAMDTQIPGLKQDNANFQNFRGKTYEQLIARDANPEVNDTMFGNMRNKDAKLQDKTTQMINGMSSISDGPSQVAFRKFKDNLLELSKTNPEAFSAMGTDAPTLIAKLKDAGDVSRMTQLMARQNPKEAQGIMKLLGMAGVDQSGALNLANKVGRYQDKAVNLLAAPARMTKKAFFELPLEATQGIANQLSTATSPNIKNLGDALSKAIANKDQVGKNAVLFSLMQNPNTRKMLNVEDDNK